MKTLSLLIALTFALLKVSSGNCQITRDSFQADKKLSGKTIVISRYDTVKINPNGEARLFLDDTIISFEITSKSIAGKRDGRNGILFSMGADRGRPNITSVALFLESGKSYFVVCQLTPSAPELRYNYFLKNKGDQN